MKPTAFTFPALADVAGYLATSPKYDLPPGLTGHPAALAAALRQRLPDEPVTATSVVTYLSAIRAPERRLHERAVREALPGSPAPGSGPRPTTGGSPVSGARLPARSCVLSPDSISVLRAHRRAARPPGGPARYSPLTWATCTATAYVDGNCTRPGWTSPTARPRPHDARLPATGASTRWRANSGPETSRTRRSAIDQAQRLLVGADGPAAFYKDANPRNFLITPAGQPGHASTSTT